MARVIDKAKVMACVNLPQHWMREARAAIRTLTRHLRETAGYNPGTEVSYEDIRLELSKLGLLGHGFSLEQIISAVKSWLGIDIKVYLYPDLSRGVLPEEDNKLKPNQLARLRWKSDLNEAYIQVRESLQYRPWPAYELSILHEVAHLLAMHHLRIPEHYLDASILKLDASSAPDASELESPYEIEARKRAKALLLATLVPEVFEGHGTDRVV
ncbi:hypothetical protein [Rubrobacter aplysinae]|uniref:hypothetical protein n=1 Tax=Rubrobacter aplysinae TaxID=909625 RepID=UPI00128CE5DF|nr:hypothetical protein [Rubrobacter aplysinae]